jgi:nitroimidazol reductase NimA-like FMN-containing flavoprotein (pyridoxamine 5'-phosphate oxidase superfamily)
MSKAELDAFLAEQRTCRVATGSQNGPHLTALWYVWDGGRDRRRGTADR